MQEHVVKSKLVAKDRGQNGYTTYVFQREDNNEYIMCSEPPNWQKVASVEVGEDGFLRYRNVIVGDKYCDSEFNEHRYRYSGSYFDTFVKCKGVTTKQIIL